MVRGPASNPASPSPAPRVIIPLMKRSHLLIDVRDLTVHREKRLILRSLDWSLRSGEHWVILGPNASGMTSLLSALNGSLFPPSGDISVLGQTFGQTDWRDLRKRVGLVSSSLSQQIGPGEIALDAVVSGREAVINSWRSPTRKERAEAGRLLELVGAAGVAGQPWGTLSQGERQRLLIARALMARPEVLILDESCAGLDPVTRELFLRFLDHLVRHPGAPALVFVTHHLEEIIPLFTHVLLLSGGRKIASGPIALTLTSRTLSETFGLPVVTRRRKGRYRLELGPFSPGD
jgi:iron complex transport system ATP-binding protein